MINYRVVPVVRNNTVTWQLQDKKGHWYPIWDREWWKFFTRKLVGEVYLEYWDEFDVLGSGAEVEGESKQELLEWAFRRAQMMEKSHIPNRLER
jgi:hypothetical protein